MPPMRIQTPSAPWSPGPRARLDPAASALLPPPVRWRGGRKRPRGISPCPAAPFFDVAELTPGLADRLSTWTRGFANDLPWREFEGIPSRSSSGGWLAVQRDLWRIRLRKASPFWWRSPAHEPLLRRLETAHGRRAGLLYRFLCMGESIGRSEAAGTGILEALERGGASALFHQAADTFSCRLTLFPFRGGFYLGDARCLHDERERFGKSPAARPAQAALQLEALASLLGTAPVGRCLEIGSGIGLVTLHLRGLAERRIGVDINPRSLAFAELNRRLAADPGARFCHSDLFGGVDGTFDLVVFNPWQPSESSLEVIERFLTQLESRLTAGGRALLVTESGHRRGRDRVHESIATHLKASSLRSTRFVVRSYRANGETRLLSLHWIDRAPPGFSGPPIRMAVGLGWAMFRLRTLRAALDTHRPKH